MRWTWLGITKTQDTLKKTGAMLNNNNPILQEVGRLGLSSMQKNFQAGGRPQPWPERPPESDRSNPLLILSHRLERSIQPRPSANRIEFSTNVPYAILQQFGYRKRAKIRIRKRKKAGTGPTTKPKNPWKIPPRPFLVLQEEDCDQMLAAWNKQLGEALN